MKTLIGALYFVFCFLLLPAHASDSLPVVSVERTHTNRPEISGPEWGYEGVRISIGVDCYSGDGFLGWPENSCSKPYVKLNGWRDAFIKVGDVRLDSEGYSSIGSGSMGQRIYEELALMEDPIVYLEFQGLLPAEYGPERARIRLVGFKEYSEDYIYSQIRRNNADYNKGLRSWSFYALSWVFGVPIAIFFAWRLVRWSAHFALIFNNYFFGFLRLSCDKYFDFKMRRAAIDEAVRQVARERVDQSRGGNEIFVRRIREALENGDIDTAKALLSILEKDSREKSS